MNIDISSIPDPKGKKKIYYKNGNTDNIIRVILLTDKEDDQRFCKFAKQFDNDLKGLEKLWRFVRFKIKYKKDPFGKQDIKTAAALWKDKVGDCKSKTLFITQILRCLKIPYKIRFTSYSKDTDIQHVYPIAILNGKEIILDSVYQSFNKEKQPVKIKDFTMTQISQISGINGPLSKLPISSDKETATKIRAEIKQIQDNISDQEPIDLKKLSVGESLLRVEKRKLELLRDFTGNDTAKAKQYNQAIRVVEDAIQKGVIGYKPSGIGVLNNISQLVSFKISRMMQDNNPAMSFKRVKKNISSIGQIYPQYGVNGNIRFDSLLQTGTPYYKFGAGTPYQTKFVDMVIPILDYLEQNKDAIVRNPDNTAKLFRKSAFEPATGVPMRLYKWFNNNGAFVSNDVLIPALRQKTASGIQQEMLNANVTFGTYDLKNEFEKYIEENSGVWDKYINNMLMKEQNTVGGVLLYEWTSDVNINNKFLTVNDLPQSVAIKRNSQVQWLDASSYLTGADRSILRSMSENTYIYGMGEQPSTTLKTLVEASKGENVSAVIATIVTIITALTPIIIAAISAMAGAKQQADGIAPNKVPQNFSPLSLSQGPQEQDFESSWFNGGKLTDNNTMLYGGLAAAALGAYLLFTQKEK